MTRRLLVLLTSFLVPSVYGQSGSDSFSRTGSVKVHVTSGTGYACDLQANVSLLSSSGTPVGENVTDKDCEVYFANVAAGSYRVTVSGPGIESSQGETVDLDPRSRNELEVTVKHAGTASQGSTTAATQPLVAAVDLNIPEGARKEFDKASQFTAKENWPKSIEHLNKAVAIYLQYAEAYNNLGVAYGRLGDRAKNLEALQKAISLNDHFAPAYVNLARIAIADRDFPQAETLLNRANAIDPTDSQTLVLLANVELLNQHYEQALATCRKAHAIPRGAHAVVHYVAARVFEHENRPAEAVAELQIFLSEEQSGPRAEAARKEMAALQTDRGAIEAVR